MATLRRTTGGGLELDGRLLKEGDAVEVQLAGEWTKGSIRKGQDLGDIFVSASGEQSVVGLEGAAARFPGERELTNPLEDAYIELLGAAGQAAAVLKLLGEETETVPGRPGHRTLQRLVRALYVVRELRCASGEATA